MGRRRRGHGRGTQAAVDDIVLLTLWPRAWHGAAGLKLLRVRSGASKPTSSAAKRIEQLVPKFVSGNAWCTNFGNGALDADKRRISWSRRPSRGDSCVSAARRAFVAARPDAAQHFRAALPC